MPKFFEEWLRSLAPQQKDEIWLYFDGSYTVCEDVSNIVGRECGCDNVVAPGHGMYCSLKDEKKV